MPKTPQNLIKNHTDEYDEDNMYFGKLKKVMGYLVDEEMEQGEYDIGDDDYTEIYGHKPRK